MRAGIMIPRARTGDVAMVSGYDALRMATLGGAKALGLDKEIGTLEQISVTPLDDGLRAHSAIWAVANSPAGRWCMTGGFTICRSALHRCTVSMP